MSKENLQEFVALARELSDTYYTMVDLCYDEDVSKLMNGEYPDGKLFKDTMEIYDQVFAPHSFDDLAFGDWAECIEYIYDTYFKNGSKNEKLSRKSNKSKKLKENYADNYFKDPDVDYVEFTVEDERGIAEYFDDATSAIRYAEDNGYDAVYVLVHYKDGESDYDGTIWENSELI